MGLLGLLANHTIKPDFGLLLQSDFDWLGQCQPTPFSLEVHKILCTMDILEVGKLSHGEASFQGQSREQSWRGNSGSLSASSPCCCKCCEAQSVLRAHGRAGFFLHPPPSPPLRVPARKSCGSCPPLPAAVSLSPGTGEDTVLGFCSSLLKGDELPQGCRFSPGEQTPAVVFPRMGQLGTVLRISTSLRDTEILHYTALKRQSNI